MSNTFTLSPAFSEMPPGQSTFSYKLTLTNNSTQATPIKLQPSLFLPTADRQLQPQPIAVVNATDFRQYLQLERTELTLAPGQTTTVTVNLLQTHPQYLLGVVANLASGKEGEITVTGGLASVVLDNDLSIDERELVSSRLTLTPSLGLGDSLSFGADVKLRTELRNNSQTKILKPTGIVSIYHEQQPELRLGAVTLTDKFSPSIYPQQGDTLGLNFTDQRPFWKRIGYQTYVQEVNVSGQTYTTSARIFSLPWEMASIGAFVLAAIFASSYLFFRRQLKGSRHK